MQKEIKSIGGFELMTPIFKVWSSSIVLTTHSYENVDYLKIYETFQKHLGKKIMKSNLKVKIYSYLITFNSIAVIVHFIQVILN